MLKAFTPKQYKKTKNRYHYDMHAITFYVHTLADKDRKEIKQGRMKSEETSKNMTRKKKGVREGDQQSQELVRPQKNGQLSPIR